jgi:hypothetical protein
MVSETRAAAGSDDDRAAAPLRKHPLEEQPPERERDSVHDQIKHENRPGKRIRLREREEEHRGQGEQLEKQRGYEEAPEGVAKPLARAVEAEERERHELRRAHEEHDPRREADVLQGEQHFRSGDMNARPEPEGEPERAGRDRGVADDRDEPECRLGGAPHDRATGFHAGRR